MNTIKVSFDVSHKDHALNHKIANFGEALWSRLRDLGLGQVDIRAIDAYETCFTVRAIHARDVRTVEKVVHILLKDHHLNESGSLKRETES